MDPLSGQDREDKESAEVGEREEGVDRIECGRELDPKTGFTELDELQEEADGHVDEGLHQEAEQSGEQGGVVHHHAYPPEHAVPSISFANLEEGHSENVLEQADGQEDEEGPRVDQKVVRLHSNLLELLREGFSLKHAEVSEDFLSGEQVHLGDVEDLLEEEGRVGGKVDVGERGVDDDLHRVHQAPELLLRGAEQVHHQKVRRPSSFD
mmetsp:Transcript_20707/g.31726  ORF Transcript_20707/g.31726 Transcript_20707/m.31726 type:complete len:209 (+) Transcript_20707:286-912(+)